jgi:hypothetical protein
MARLRISAAARDEALDRLKDYSCRHGGGFFRTEVNHAAPAARRYRAQIIVDTVGLERHSIHIRDSEGDFINPFALNAYGFMDDFGSLICTTRFS